jgi:hypothetical protein
MAIKTITIDTWMVHSYATDENWRQVTEQLAIEEAEEESA